MNRLPLQGVRILELGGYIAGPYATTILAGLGAEVVKVESPDGGDPFRRGDENRSPYFIQYNAGKKSIAIDLKRSAGVKLVLSLLPRFDVLVENLRPGKLSAIGLGPDVCRSHNAALIYASVTGFGSGGPLVDRPAYDTIGASLGGLYSLMSDPGNAQLAGTCLVDLITGIITATGVLAALVGRGHPQSGAGALVETSMLEAVSTLTIDAMTQMFEIGGDPTRESRHPQAQSFCLRTSSGQLITLHLSSSEKFWRSLATTIGRPDLADDARFRRYLDRVANYRSMREIIAAEFAKRPMEEWERLLTAADIPFAPVLGLTQVAAHPQTDWLHLLERQKSGLMLVRPPWRFGGKRAGRTEAGPTVGQHSREIAGEVCDLQALKALVADGVLFDAAADTT